MENCAYLRKNPGYAPDFSSEILENLKKLRARVPIAFVVLPSFLSCFNLVRVCHFITDNPSERPNFERVLRLRA